MKLFDLSILFVDRDFLTYVFCFVGPPSIDMAKSIYGLGFESLGRPERVVGFCSSRNNMKLSNNNNNNMKP
jgi:hypothetical protein